MKISIPAIQQWTAGFAPKENDTPAGEIDQGVPDPAKTGTGSEMDRLLDEMEQALLAGRAIPWTPLAVVDRQEIQWAIDRLRTALPPEVEAARRIVQGEETVLAAARAESHGIISRAEKQAREILEESQLKRIAENRAREILEEAQRQAGRILQDAGTQAWSVYQSLEKARDLLQGDLLRIRSRLREAGHSEFGTEAK